MKHLFNVALILLLLPLTSAAAFSVTGTVKGINAGAIDLEYVNQNGEDTLVSAAINNGNFIINGQLAEPGLARLTVKGDWSYSQVFFIEDRPIRIQLVKDSGDKTVFYNAPANVVFEKLNNYLPQFFADARQNQAIHQQSPADYTQLKLADSIWNKQQQTLIHLLRNEIRTNKKNYVVMNLMKWLLFKPDNPDSIYSLYLQLDPTVRNGVAGKKFKAEFDHTCNILPGSKAPEVNGSDTTGKKVTLAQFKGKVLLLDFWASYCGPCRNENKQMSAVYKNYAARGFEILSFSLDNDRGQWISAIKADGMPWTQASELRGGASASAGVYDITEMPRNVLISRTGKIIAKNLHGNDLTTAIEQALKE